MHEKDKPRYAALPATHVVQLREAVDQSARSAQYTEESSSDGGLSRTDSGSYRQLPPPIQFHFRANAPNMSFSVPDEAPGNDERPVRELQGHCAARVSQTGETVQHAGHRANTGRAVLAVHWHEVRLLAEEGSQRVARVFEKTMRGTRYRMLNMHRSSL